MRRRLILVGPVALAHVSNDEGDHGFVISTVDGADVVQVVVTRDAAEACAESRDRARQEAAAMHLARVLGHRHLIARAVRRVRREARA